MTDGRSAIKIKLLFHLKFNNFLFTLSVILASNVSDSDFTSNTDDVRG